MTTTRTWMMPRRIAAWITVLGLLPAFHVLVATAMGEAAPEATSSARCSSRSASPGSPGGSPSDRPTSLVTSNDEISRTRACLRRLRSRRRRTQARYT